MEKALVVDGDFLMRGFAADSLGREGVQVEEASTACEALRLQAAEPYDFIFADLEILGTDGRGLRRDPAALVVVTTSFRTMEKAIQMVKQGKTYDYLVKPFSADQVAVILERAREVLKLRAHIRMLEGQPADRGPEAPVAEAGAVPAITNLQELERQTILRVMDETGGSRNRMAEMLGISVRTLRNKLSRYRQEAAC